MRRRDNVGGLGEHMTGHVLVLRDIRELHSPYSPAQSSWCAVKATGM